MSTVWAFVWILKSNEASCKKNMWCFKEKCLLFLDFGVKNGAPVKLSFNSTCAT